MEASMMTEKGKGRLIPKTMKLKMTCNIRNCRFKDSDFRF